eukprot:13450636-Alexandrium_andersonii.AAC.1
MRSRSPSVDWHRAVSPGGEGAVRGTPSGEVHERVIVSSGGEEVGCSRFPLEDAGSVVRHEA